MASQPRSTIEIVALYRDSLSALGNAATFLLNNTRPSLWRRSGKGWQELWDKAPHAGIYASCDGLLLIQSVGLRHPQRAQIEELADQVYEHTICPALDPTIRPTTEAQSRVKAETRWTTMKLAKFLQATVTRRSLTAKQKRLKQLAHRWLLTEGRANNGRWRPYLGSTESPSVAATAEALIAIQPLRGPRVRSQTRAGIAYLSSVAVQHHDRNPRITALWALSELARRGEIVDNPLFMEAMRRDLLFPDLSEESIYTEKFWDHRKNKSDYYSFNMGFLTATTILNYVSLSWLPRDLIISLLPFIADVSKNLIDNGRYLPVTNNRNPTFWENCQAIVLLKRFVDAIDNDVYPKELKFMYVKPRFFHATSFLEESDLCVVIMPLTTVWQSDVYDAFSQAVREKGFRIWRSDQEALDDAIMQTVWEHINRARFIIADCTGKNPNVFYELGIAHTIGKPVFLCAQSRKDFPFDIAPIRSHEYGTLSSQLALLKSKVQAFIERL